MLRASVLVVALTAVTGRMSKNHKQHKRDQDKEKLAEQKRVVERLYYAPYKYYGRPLHLLTDVEWGNFERRSRKPRACALPTNVPGDPQFYLFSYLRDDSPGLLAHFLRWYKAAGIDFQRARFVIHGLKTEPGDTSDASRTAKVFRDYRVPASSLKYVSSYSSTLKTEAVNAYMDDLPLEAWLVYPDLDEFFAYPCYWGGRVLSLVDHMARQSVDGPMAASIVADTSKPEFAWLKQLAATTPHYRDAPWHPNRQRPADFVGGEMYDRVARTWKLEEVVPPPQPFSPSRWTDADIGARSLFHQFPHSLRATGCLLHARPFKHVLTGVACRGDDGALVHRQRFESSHLTGCYTKVNGEWVKAERKAQMHETQLAFAHFRFTSNASQALYDKRKAYEAASEAFKQKLAADGLDEATAPPPLKAELANLNHAQKTYQAQQLLFEESDGLLSFRDAVQLVLLLDCNADRPLPKPDEAGVIPPMLYGPQTSGRLEDAKRKALLALLATADKERACKLANALFTAYYPPARNLTKSNILNKRLAAYQFDGVRRDFQRQRIGGRGQARPDM